MSNPCKTALLIGKAEREEFKKMETIQTSPFEGKSSCERHQGKRRGQFLEKGNTEPFRRYFRAQFREDIKESKL